MLFSYLPLDFLCESKRFIGMCLVYKNEDVMNIIVTDQTLLRSI